MLPHLATARSILNAITPARAAIWALCAGALLASAAALAQPAAPPPSAEEMAATEIAVLEFLGGGSPLTREERQQAIEASALAARLQPAFWIKATMKWRSILQRAAGDHVYEGDVREGSRYTVQSYAQNGHGDVLAGMEPVDAIENRIILAHDPVVVFDPQHKFIVTEHTLQVLQQAAAWMSENAGLPGPGADFTDRARQWIRSSYASLDAETAEALAAIERDLPAAYDSLRQADPQRREATMGSVRAAYQAVGPGRDLKMAETAALMARLNYQQTAQAQQANAIRAMTGMMETMVMGQVTRRSMYWGQRAVQPNTRGCTVTTLDRYQIQTTHCNP